MSSISVDVEIEEGDVIMILTDELEDVMYEVEEFNRFGMIDLRSEGNGEIEVLYLDEFEEVVNNARLFTVDRV